MPVRSVDLKQNPTHKVKKTLSAKKQLSKLNEVLAALSAMSADSVAKQAYAQLNAALSNPQLESSAKKVIAQTVYAELAQWQVTRAADGKLKVGNSAAVVASLKNITSSLSKSGVLAADVMQKITSNLSLIQKSSTPSISVPAQASFSAAGLKTTVNKELAPLTLKNITTPLIAFMRENPKLAAIGVGSLGLLIAVLPALIYRSHAQELEAQLEEQKSEVAQAKALRPDLDLKQKEISRLNQEIARLTLDDDAKKVAWQKQEVEPYVGAIEAGHKHEIDQLNAKHLVHLAEQSRAVNADKNNTIQGLVTQNRVLEAENAALRAKLPVPSGGGVS